MTRTRHWWRIGAAAIAACCGAIGSAQAADTPEVEPNDAKATATAATMANGDTVSGTSTSSSGTGLDYFRIKTAAAAPGIYRHELALTSSIAGHAVTLRGLNQSGNVVGTSDTAIQTASSSDTPARRIVWYGFGKGEEVYYRVAGTGSTTATYTATLSDTSVAAVEAVGSLYSGNIQVRVMNGSGSMDSEFWLYDSNFNALQTNVPSGSGPAGADNSLVGGSPTGTQSSALRTLTPGVYYMAIAPYQFGNNLPSPVPDWASGNVMDFPDALFNGSVASTSAYTVTAQFVDASSNTVTSPSMTWGPSAYTGLIQFVKFTVLAPPIPTGIGSATPNPVASGASTTISVAVTPASGGSLDDITSVTANVFQLTGNADPDTLTLTRDGLTSNWTGMVTTNALLGGVKSVPFHIVEGGAFPGVFDGSFNVTLVGPGQTCSAPITLQLSMTEAFDLSSSTTNSDGGLCSTGVKGLWYQFTAPPAGGAFRFTATATSGTGNPSIILFSTCGGAQVVCVNPCGGTVSTMTRTLAGNEVVVMRLGGCADTQWAGTFAVTEPVATGICCNSSTGACSVQVSNEPCPSGTALGTGTTCAPGTPSTSCPQTGACCDGTTCSVGVTQAACSGANNLWLGANSTCNSAPANNYPGPSIPIVDNTLTGFTNTITVTGTSTPITDVNIFINFSHIWAGDVAARITGPNGMTVSLVGRPGATNGCNPLASNFEGIQVTADGLFIFDDQQATNFNQAAIAASPGTMAPGSYKPSDCGTADANLNAAFGSLPNANGDWTLFMADSGPIIAGTMRSWAVQFNNVAPSTACDVAGACCNGASCSFVTAENCPGAPGNFQGSGSTCSPSNPCGATTQFCCRGTTCVSVASGSCTGTVGNSASTVSGACGPHGSIAGCCYADYDHSGTSTIDDLFIYINTWLLASPYTKINGDAVAAPSIDDLFIFINLWLVGCQP